MARTLLTYFSSLLIVLASTHTCLGQSNFSLRYFGLTVHPFGDSQAHLQPYRFDDNAYLVGNIGGLVSYESFFHNDYFAVQSNFGLFTDCSAGLAGIVHVGISSYFLRKRKHTLSFSFGPMFLMREDWNRFDDYIDSGSFGRASTRLFGDVQFGFYPFVPQLSYDYRISDKFDLSTGFTVGLPVIFTASIGVKYWINKDFIKTFKLPVKK